LDLGCRPVIRESDCCQNQDGDECSHQDDHFSCRSSSVLSEKYPNIRFRFRPYCVSS
jgi:hypothetical protein